jgi:hypothetical protein
MTDLECPSCGAQLDRLTCEDCGARCGEVFGVPFIGEYERADILGLIEIAAHAGLPVSPMSSEEVRLFEEEDDFESACFQVRNQRFERNARALKGLTRTLKSWRNIFCRR